MNPGAAGEEFLPIQNKNPREILRAKLALRMTVFRLLQEPAEPFRFAATNLAADGSLSPSARAAAYKIYHQSFVCFSAAHYFSFDAEVFLVSFEGSDLESGFEDFSVFSDLSDLSDLSDFSDFSDFSEFSDFEASPPEVLRP